MLLDSHEKKLLNSHEEKLLDKQNCSNQPNQFQTQLVIDKGDLVSRMTWSVFKMKEKRPVLKTSVWILFTKNPVLQIEQGDLLKQN